MKTSLLAKCGLVLICLNCLITFISSTPPSPALKKPPPPKKWTGYPTLPENCSWGKIIQNQEIVAVEGRVWKAEGFWYKGKERDSEKFKLILGWYQFNWGPETFANGIYAYDKEKDCWAGKWGYEYEGFFIENGEIHPWYDGPKRDDMIYSVKPVEDK